MNEDWHGLESQLELWEERTQGARKSFSNAL